MSAERFTLDTNVLVYSVDIDAGMRHEQAAEIVERSAKCDCWLTLQSISEFYSALMRKGIARPRVAAALADDLLDVFPTAGPTASAVRTALAAASAGGRVSYWDALLISTAKEAGCVAILTEDLGGAAAFDGVRIHNPFGRHGLTDRARELLGLT